MIELYRTLRIEDQTKDGCLAKPKRNVGSVWLMFPSRPTHGTKDIQYQFPQERGKFLNYMLVSSPDWQIALTIHGRTSFSNMNFPLCWSQSREEVSLLLSNFSQLFNKDGTSSLDTSSLESYLNMLITDHS